MELRRSQLGQISRSMVRALVEAGDIEVTSENEVMIDVQSVLNNYLTQEAGVVQRARELVQQRGLPQGEFGRIKQLVAKQQGIEIGEDALDYVLGQLLNMLMHSNNVEEVYAEDHAIKRQLRTFLRGETSSNDDIEAEVRSKLKHVEEGSRIWEIEYARLKDDIKRRRGM